MDAPSVDWGCFPEAARAGLGSNEDLLGHTGGRA